MSYRGRLLQPFRVELERLDTAATQAAGGYDPILKVTKPTYDDDGNRIEPTRFLPAVKVLAQVEQTTSKAQQQGAAGDVPDSRYQLVIHFRELEARGLLDANRDPVFRPNDRLIAIYTRSDVLEQRFAPPLRVVETQTTGFGIGGRRNLCVLIMEDRPTGIRS